MNAVDQIRKIFALGMWVFELRWSQFVDLYGTETFKMLGGYRIITFQYYIALKQTNFSKKIFFHTQHDLNVSMWTTDSNNQIRYKNHKIDISILSFTGGSSC